MFKITPSFSKSRVLSGTIFYSKQPKNELPVNQNQSEVSKESLQWRTPWDQKSGHWYSKLKVFASDANNADIIKFLQSPIKITPTSLIKWWERKREDAEKCMQQYIPERNRILEDDLAAAHFIVHRGGAVKFFGEDDWVKQNDDQEYNLPNKFVPNKIIQAIDCENMRLHYEGLENLRGLKKLECLNLKDGQYIDDWCMDKISGMFQENLQYLDIRGCKNVTYRGIGAFYRLKKLKTLYVDDVKANKSLELTCLMLQELLPELEIKM